MIKDNRIIEIVFFFPFFFRGSVFQRWLHLCSYNGTDTPSTKIDSQSLAALILCDFGARLQEGYSFQGLSSLDSCPWKLDATL